MLEFIIRMLLEAVFGFVGGVLASVFVETSGGSHWINKAGSNLLTALVLFVFGAFIGWVSLWIFPAAFVSSDNFHGISLVITPVLAGLAMAVFGWLRQGRGKPLIRLGNFAFGYVVAFGLALMRFYFTE